MELGIIKTPGEAANIFFTALRITWVWMCTMKELTANFCLTVSSLLSQEFTFQSVPIAMKSGGILGSELKMMCLLLKPNRKFFLPVCLKQLMKLRH